MSIYSEAQRKACKKYYEINREKRIERAKEYSKKNYVPVKQKTKNEYRDEFIKEIIPLIEEHLYKDEDQRIENPIFNEKEYLNFRKTILVGCDKIPLVEIFVSRDCNQIYERAWFYKKSQWKKKKNEIEYNEWIMVDYSKSKSNQKISR